MRLIPAIDLKGGRCVRLLRAILRPRPATTSSRAALLARYRRPRRRLAACRRSRRRPRRQRRQSRHHRRSRRPSRLKLQVGGGLRNTARGRADARPRRRPRGRRQRRAHQGGSGRAWLKDFGTDRITLAFDVRLDADGTPCVATHGWRRQSELSLWDAVGEFGEFRARARALHRREPRRRADGTEYRAVRRGRAALPADRVAGLRRHPRRGGFARSGRMRRRARRSAARRCSRISSRSRSCDAFLPNA